MKARFIIFAFALPTAATAQSYSESMADCASFYQNAAQWVRTDEKAEQIMANTRKWHAAAVTQARAEGRPVTADAMWDKINAKTDAWEAKGLGFAFTQEFRDWASYCRKFAKHTGVDLTF
ncbi:hypothetical protein AB2B41_08620 [Marimonas sp. MJW-29]|uniref:Uncharacterized protein n=1 Tax=Sulfitobacter sediminis TaxID=3234186 RepID=A0ABV3RL85_9RHOB